MPTEQGLQPWTQPLEVIIGLQLAEQRLAGAKLLVQGVLVQLVEVAFAELVKEVPRGRQHAGHREHEHQAQPRRERQPRHDGSGSSSM